MPVRVVEIVPAAVVEIVPVRVVDIVPNFVVEIVPVFDTALMDRARTKNVAHGMYFALFIDISPIESLLGPVHSPTKLGVGPALITNGFLLFKRHAKFDDHVARSVSQVHAILNDLTSAHVQTETIETVLSRK